ncbi:MAG: DNA mismatch repair protein MutS [Alphaproteobacteria bacterium]
MPNTIPPNDDTSDLLSPLKDSANHSPPLDNHAQNDSENNLPKDATLTPLMAQYQSLKSQHPDNLLFFRLGDFYELFFDDAIETASLLNLTLTRRGKQNDKPIPMCGVPYHAVDNYIAKLIAMGKKIALAEQITDQSSHKNLMMRKVVRIITPGTVFEDSLLADKTNNFLIAIYPHSAIGGKHNPPSEKSIVVATSDVSTGFLAVETIPLSLLSGFISKISPAEILIPDNMLKDENIALTIRDFYEKITPEAHSIFHHKRGKEMLEQQFQVKSLAGFGDFNHDELAVLAGLLSYLKRTQIDTMPRLLPPKKNNPSDVVAIDRASFQSLEILTSQSSPHSKSGSLLDMLDKTQTAAGARLLRSRLQQPLKNHQQINARLDLLAFFVDNQPLSDSIKQHLTALPDISRALSRLSVKKGGPRDLAAIAQVLEKIPAIKQTLRQFLPTNDEHKLSQDEKKTYQPIIHLLTACPDILPIRQTLQDALLMDNLPLLARDGGFIRAGFRHDLDNINTQKQEKQRQLKLLEQTYRTTTQIDSLKIKHNHIWGFYVEIPAKHAGKMAQHHIFQHRQTLSSLVRYNSAELIDLGSDIEKSINRALALELGIFDELVDDILDQHMPLMKTADLIAVLDLNQTIATIARNQHFTRPDIIANDDGNNRLELHRARHPVVEQALEKQANHFTANDILLDDKLFFMLLTAPNMAGKSTFLRMVAIIVVMAQSGCYVPADRAVIAVVDKIFSRVGASDDLARGQSTFMVEMLETAHILQNATRHSLIIMDEIGRGTATFDGLSLAIAITEHLHNHIHARLLFATHYHELTKLAQNLKSMTCFTMKVEEWDNKLVFFHELISGSANHSYGIQVASMAGVPKSVIGRATHILKELETHQ